MQDEIEQFRNAEEVLKKDPTAKADENKTSSALRACTISSCKILESSVNL